MVVDSQPGCLEDPAGHLPLSCPLACFALILSYGACTFLHVPLREHCVAVDCFVRAEDAQSGGRRSPAAGSVRSLSFLYRKTTGTMFSHRRTVLSSSAYFLGMNVWKVRLLPNRVSQLFFVVLGPRFYIFCRQTEHVHVPVSDMAGHQTHGPRQLCMVVLPKTVADWAGVKGLRMGRLRARVCAGIFFSSGEELRQDMVAWCLHLAV